MRLLTHVHLWPRRVLMALVRAYRLVLSPWLGNQCRFEPTCSVYALGALQAHGAAAGSYLAAARILRCSPFCDGGHDPVPARAPRLFAWWATCEPSAAPPAAPSTSSSSKTSP